MPEYFNSIVWSSLFDFNASTRNLLTGLLMSFELFYNLVLLVFAVLVVFLFYNRRTILPRFVIIFYLTTLLFLIIDTFIAFNLNPEAYTDAEKTAIYGDIVRAFITSAIWIPYFIYSKRVKETFVRTSQRSQVNVVPELPLPKSPRELKPKRKSFQYAVWIVAAVLILGIIIIGFSYLTTGSDHNNWHRKSEAFIPSWLNPAFPDTASTFDILSNKPEQSQDWKYIILECQSKQDDEVTLAIIAVNDRPTANDILNRLRAGASFSLIAMEESGHPSKEIGGYLGRFQMEDLNEKFQKALIEIEEGEYTDIIEMTTAE